MKPLRIRTAARRDVEDAVRYYVREAGRAVARQFTEAVDAAFSSIAAAPATGSPRYSHVLDVPGLRTYALKRFPYLALYIDRADHIDVVRVLNGARHIPATLSPDRAP